jgi:hypothetical protein
VQLRASLTFLQHLCTTLNCGLIFQVSIQREVRYKYRDGREEYTTPQYRIFILSKEGQLITMDLLANPGKSGGDQKKKPLKTALLAVLRGFYKKLSKCCSRYGNIKNPSKAAI